MTDFVTGGKQLVWNHIVNHQRLTVGWTWQPVTGAMAVWHRLGIMASGSFSRSERKKRRRASRMVSTTPSPVATFPTTSDTIRSTFSGRFTCPKVIKVIKSHKRHQPQKPLLIPKIMRYPGYSTESIPKMDGFISIQYGSTMFNCYNENKVKVCNS